MSRRITTRTAIVGLAGIVLMGAGATAQAGWIFVLAAGVLGLLPVSLLVAHRLASCEITREVPDRSMIGQDAATHLTVRNAGRRRLPPLRIEDHFEGFERAAVASERLAPGQQAVAEMVRTTRRRGEFLGGRVDLVAGWPFGLVRSRRSVVVPSPMVVVPHWVDLSSFPILEPSSSPTDVLHERARTGAGEEYIGVREYRPGDPRRAVHWRSSARAGYLVVREYEEQASTRVAVVLAGVEHGDPPDSSFEALVAAAASIALYSLVTGHPVELVRAAPDGPLERLSDPDRAAVLDWLAGARPADTSVQALVADALVRLGRRGTVVICCPTAGAAGAGLEEAINTAQTAGARAVAVVADSDSWAGDGGDGEEPALGALRRGRAVVRVLARGQPLAQCLQT